MMRFRPRAGIVLFIALTVSLVPPILMSGVWLGHQDAKEAITQFDSNAKLVALSTADAIQELISLKIEVLNVTAGTLSALPEWEIDHLQKLMDAQIKSSGSFDSFYVGDMRGRSLVFAPSVRPDGVATRAGVNYSDREYFQLLKASNKPSFGPLKRGKQSGVANVHIAVPIYEDLTLKSRSRARGYITAGLKPQLIDQVVKRILKGDGRLRVVTIEKSGSVISDTLGKLEPLMTLNREVVFQGGCDVSAQARVGLNDLGEEVRAFCTRIKLGDQHWYLWVSRTQESIQSTAKRSLLLTILIVTLLITVVLGVALSLSLSLGRLMNVVSTNAQKIGDGDFNIQLPRTRWYSPRELVEVSDLVLKTLSRLSDSDDQVQKLVKDLKEINDRQASLVEAWRQVREAIEIIDDQGRVLYVNPAFNQLFIGAGHAQIEPGQPSPLMNITGEDSQMSSSSDSLSLTSSSGRETVGEEILSEAQRGYKWHGEIEITIAQRRRLHEINSSPIVNDQGELLQVIVIHRDMTEERIAQASAAHNDRLAAIGTLAAGMAHEINNPLMYIKTNVELVQEELSLVGESPLDPEMLLDISDALNDASEGVERVSTIVKSLLSIARSGGEGGRSEAMQIVDVGDLVMTCANLVKPELSKRVRLQVDIPETMMVWGRRSELIQVLLNLLINASQAMPQREKRGLIRISGYQTGPDQVLIKVTDNAGGIPPDILPHIFEPFFSSKPVNKGTGLGLSVSRGIIEAHNGQIDVTSTLNAETTFTITLPTNQRSHREDLIAQLSPSLDHPSLLNSIPEIVTPLVTPQSDASDISHLSTSLLSRKILIVDDDILVAKSLSKLLKGENVQRASSGAEALEITRSEEFDVILSDVMMPELDGPSFYWRLIERSPHYRSKFIFITGATKGDGIYQSLIATQRPILNKPISRAELLEVITSLKS